MDEVANAKPNTISLKFAGVAPNAKVEIERVDETHGNPLHAYVALGSPTYPTREQVTQMNAASALGAPEESALHDGQLELTLPVNGLTVIEIPVSQR